MRLMPRVRRAIKSLGQKKRDAMHRSVVSDTQTIVMVNSQVRLRTARSFGVLQMRPPRQDRPILPGKWLEQTDSGRKRVAAARGAASVR